MASDVPTVLRTEVRVPRPVQGFEVPVVVTSLLLPALAHAVACVSHIKQARYSGTSR